MRSGRARHQINAVNLKTCLLIEDGQKDIMREDGVGC